MGYDHSDSSPTRYRPDGTVTNVGAAFLPPTTGMAGPVGSGDSVRPGEQHGPVMVSVSPSHRYWMAVATRMSSSGLIRWSWLSSPIRSSTQLTVPVNRLESPE